MYKRQVLDYPLGATDARADYTVMANTLGADVDPQQPMAERMAEVWRRYPDAKIHLYGKDHRPGRKIGHVNLTGTDVEQVRADARAAAHYIVHAQWP